MFRKTILILVVLALAALTVVALTGCPNNQPPATPAAPTNATSAVSAPAATMTLTAAGATFPYPIYSKWFDMYEQAHGVKINYQSIGSGGGIQQLTAKTIDFGASDAPLSDDETKKMPGAVVHIPTVAGADVVTYNVPGVTTGLKLTGDAIAGIFLGTIKKWNDPAIKKANPDVKLPDTAISVAHRSDGSGTTYIFTHYLAAVSSEWKSQVGAGKSVNWPVGIGGKGNEGVAGVVKQTPGSVGYIELAYAVQNKLPYADVKNSTGEFITPTTDSTTAAANGGVEAMKKDIRTVIVNSPEKGAYPIAGFTYVLLYQDQADAAKGKAIVDFLNWAMTEGQKECAALYYAPLPAGVVALNQAALKTITFAGKPQ